MNTDTRDFLFEFLKGIPAIKRQLKPDICQPMDFKRLIKVAIELESSSDSFDEYDIKSICEEIGDDSYLSLINEPDFINDFARPIFLEINNAKSVIETYKSILNEP